MRSEEQIREVRYNHEKDIARDSKALGERLKQRNITPDEEREISKELERRRQIVRTLSWVLEEYYSETLT